MEDANGAGTIRPGFAPDLDDAVAAVRGTREWLAALEGRERERTGIRSLKVGFNKVFGYYIEVTRPTWDWCQPSTRASRRSPTASVTSRRR